MDIADTSAENNVSRKVLYLLISKQRDLPTDNNGIVHPQCHSHHPSTPIKAFSALPRKLPSSSSSTSQPHTQQNQQLPHSQNQRTRKSNQPTQSKFPHTGIAMCHVNVVVWECDCVFRGDLIRCAASLLLPRPCRQATAAIRMIHPRCPACRRAERRARQANRVNGTHGTNGVNGHGVNGHGVNGTNGYRGVVVDEEDSSEGER